MSTDPTNSPRKLVKHHDNGEPHFLTFSCYRRLGLLSKDRTRRWFVDALNDARATHGFHLWAWVIMPEHVPLLIWPPSDRIASDPQSTRGRMQGILSSIKRPVSFHAIEFLRANSPEFLKRLTVVNANRTSLRFWQPGSGYDKNVSEPVALHEIVEYIHMNPVRRGLVSRGEDWPWSSAAEWMGLADPILKIERTLSDAIETPWKNRPAN